jgi:hypothetical protein
MRTLYYKTLAAVGMFAMGISVTVAQDQKTQIAACIDNGFDGLISAQSQEFSSTQYMIKCQYSDINKRKRNETFTYEPPTGFQIGSARLKVVMKTPHTSFGDLKFQGQRATVSLQCQGREDMVSVGTFISVNIVGQLIYQTTAEDAKSIASSCLDKIL